MEDEKKAFDELAFIKKMMLDSQKLVIDNGMGYIIWGILITVGMLGGYVQHLLKLNFNYIWVWAVIIPIGWVFTYFKYYRKKEKIDTFAGRIIGRLWFSVGLCMTIIGFAGYFSGALPGECIAPIQAIIVGAGYYIASIPYNLNWYRYIGAGWWIGGMVMFWVQDMNQLLIMSALMILGQILPGIICYRNYKAQYSEKQ